MARLTLVDTSMKGAYRPGATGISPDSARRLVFSEQNVQPRQLEEFARRKGGDPESMARIWERIDAVSDSLRAAGWRPGGGTAGPGEGGTGRDTAGR